MIYPSDLHVNAEGRENPSKTTPICIRSTHTIAVRLKFFIAFICDTIKFRATFSRQPIRGKYSEITVQKTRQYFNCNYIE